MGEILDGNRLEDYGENTQRASSMDKFQSLSGQNHKTDCEVYMQC